MFSPKSIGGYLWKTLGGGEEDDHGMPQHGAEEFASRSLQSAIDSLSVSKSILSSANTSSNMSLAGKEKEKRAESASSGSVTDVSGLPAIEDEDSEGKYEYYQMPGGTVYRICLLGNMFESFYVVFGLITVVAGMFAAWAIHYAASPSREESEEDESGTDIDNPEKSSSKEEHRRTNSNESPDDSGIGTVAENSTGPENANQTRRRIGSDSESTHSSLDDFADAMDSVQHPDDYPVSYRLADEPSDASRDQNMDDAVYRDQARDIVDQALDDAFEILDNEGKELLKGNDVAETQNVSQPAPTDHAVEDVKLPGDVLVKSEWDSNSDLGVDEALDDAYAVLDMQNIDESPKNNSVKDENNLDKSYSVPVNEDVKLSLTSAEESIPQSSAILEDQDDRQEKPGQSEEGTSEEKDITTLKTSVEYVTVEQHDVPNAPVVKNAIDDDVVEDGSDDTTTSSDADTVKDAGGDVKAREQDLDRDERTEVENVVADLISNEMVKEWTCDLDDEIEHDEEKSDAGNVVADAISDDMVKDGRGDIAAAEHDLPREEVLEGGNTVADRPANEMVNETRYDMDIPNEAFHGKVCENDNDLVQPVDSQEVECMLGSSPNEVSDEAIYDENRVGVENVVADSLANEMILDILDELAIKDRSTLAADDSELPQTVVDEKAEEELRSYRRVSDGPIPQIRIDSVDDDIVEEDSIPEDFASPQSVIRYETENTSALPDGADDHSVPNDDEEFAKDTYKVSDYLPESDENQNQTKLNTQLPVDVNVTVSVRHDEEKQLENDFKSGAEVESDSDMHIVATVKTPHEDTTNVKDLLTKLTGEEIPSVYAEDEGETGHDHKVGMVEFMATIGRTNVDDHGDKDDGEGIDIDQRSVVNEEFITSVAARQVECSSIDAFCFRPQEPSDMDNKNDADLSAPQDLGAKQSDREESLDFQRTGSIINVQHEQQTEAAAPTNQDSDDQIVIASVTVPKTNVRDVLSSLVGEGYTEVQKEEDGDETADIRIEDFLLADVKMQHVVDLEHSDEHLHDKEPICENTVIPAPVSVDDSKDVDFLSSITSLNDQEQIPPDDKLDRQVGPKILIKDDEEIVPRTAAAAEAGPELDVSNILSKIPQATPSTVTPIKEDDVVPTDVRKTVNGHVNLKSVLKSLGSELSVDIDLDDSDVSEASPPRKRVITDAMVREAIQFLLQKPFLYSYGMYDSQDSLFYKSLLDDPILPGGRAFALVSNLVGKDLTPEQKSTLFALVSSPSKENLDDDDYPSDVDEPIFPDMQNEDEAKINFDELFTSLERRPSEQDDQVNISPKQVVTESYIADTRKAMEEAVPESSERVTKGYPEVEDAVPERLRPDTISYSDDDSSSVSSSDTSGTYILDNQVGLVEEDEEEQERPVFKEPRDPRDVPHHAPRELPGYQGYSHEPYQEEEEEEKKEEVSEKPQASRMFFITSAMLAQMAEQQNCDSSSDSNYERRGRQSDSPVSSSSEDYLEEIPPGYGPNSGSSWSQDPATMGYHQYLHQDDSVRSYPSEVPTAEYDNDNDMRFRPISGGESSLEPTPRITTSYPLKDNQEIMHPSQNGHHVFSDYDSSSELLEIEKQRQRLFPSSPNDDNLPPQKTEKLQNGNTVESLRDQPLPIAEPAVTLKVNYPDETTPARMKDVFENGALNSGQPLAGDFQPIPEPTITRDMSVPEQVQPVFARSIFNQGLRDDDPRTNSTAQSHESLDSYPTRHPEQNLISGEYGKINGHTEPLSQSEDSMWSHSDYRGYSGSSEDGDYDDDTSFASGERMFALVGLPSNSPTAALSVTASIEVYRAEEHMEIQKSLYSYEISKGTAGPDGKMVKLQEQSFSFERRSDIVVESIDGRHEMTFSESVSESAGEQSLRPEEHSRNHPEDLSKEHPKELHEQSFASDHRSDTVEDLIDSPGEGFSMNETVTADFSSEQFVPPPAQAHDYHQEEFKLDLPFDSAGEELSEREGLQRQVESLSELLSEKTLDMQRFKDDYPFLDRILSNPNETVPGYEEGQLIGLLETYRQLEEDVLELMNIYKETKTQLAELDQMERA